MLFCTFESSKNQLRYPKKANGQAFRSVEVQKSTKTFSHGLDLRVNRSLHFILSLGQVGGRTPLPQIFADQLTLYQPDYALQLLHDPPRFSDLPTSLFGVWKMRKSDKKQGCTVVCKIVHKIYLYGVKWP